MVTGDQTNNDFMIGGPPEFQQRIRNVLTEYDDIFSFNVKGKSMAVPPMHFTVDMDGWEVPASRLPSRHISVEKHVALNKMIDDLLDLQAIQPSRATAWSQVNLVHKPTNGWQFTVDYRTLNKVITNEGFNHIGEFPI